MKYSSPTEVFRLRLRALIEDAAAAGLDVFALHAELLEADRWLVEDARCDLVVYDEED